MNDPASSAGNALGHITPVVAALTAMACLLIDAGSNLAIAQDQTQMKEQPAAILRPIHPMPSLVPGISPAVLVERGNLLFLSGHLPTTSQGAVVSPDVACQADQVFRNLGATLKAAGSDFRHVARLTIYVRDFDAKDLPAIRAVRDRYLDPEHAPASALIGVASLFHPDVRIEIDAVAVVPTAAPVGGAAGGN